jgi:hypothetical protein
MQELESTLARREAQNIKRMEHARATTPREDLEAMRQRALLQGPSRYLALAVKLTLRACQQSNPIYGDPLRMPEGDEIRFAIEQLQARVSFARRIDGTGQQATKAK